MALEEIASNSDELFTGGNGILNAMSQLTDVTVKIKERSATMDNFITDVSRIVEDAAQLSYSNMEDMDRIAESGEKINQTMEKMKQHTSQIDKLGRQLTSDLQHLDAE